MSQSISIRETNKFARAFAIENSINYIDIAMVILGVLQTDEQIANIFGEDKDSIIAKLTTRINGLARLPYKSESVPLTKEAATLIRFSNQYAKKIGGYIENYQIILAALSYRNFPSEIFKKAGWTYEIFLTHLNRIMPAKITTEKLLFNIKPSRNKPFSEFEKVFLFSKKKHIAKLNKEALLLYNVRQYEVCKKICQIILDLDPKANDQVGIIIACLQKEGLFEQGIEYYKIHPVNNKVALDGLAACYRRIGKPEKAIDVYESMKDKTVAIYNNLGFSLGDAGRYEEAIAILDKAISLNKEFAFAYNNKGFALLKTGHPVEAKDNIIHSLSLHKGNSYAYRNLALVYIDENNKQAALDAVDKALLYQYREDYGDDILNIREEANNL